MLLLLLVLSIGGLGGYYLGQTSNSNQKLFPPTQVAVASPVAAPVASAVGDETGGWKTYTGDGFSIQYPDDWQGLQNTCQSISVYKSDSSESKLSLEQYVNKKMGFIAGYTDELKRHPPTEALFSFLNLPLQDVFIIGPQGEGEINNIFIKGPQNYFQIIVMYSGPIPDSAHQCIGTKASEYKQILSTFRFTN